VPLDYIEAYKWFALASAHGESASKGRLKELTEIMTPHQIEIAKQRIAEWHSTHHSSEGRSSNALDIAR